MLLIHFQISYQAILDNMVSKSYHIGVFFSVWNYIEEDGNKLKVKVFVSFIYIKVDLLYWFIQCTCEYVALSHSINMVFIWDEVDKNMR